MRIVFMGTPEFAVASLKAIHESDHEVVAVITALDKPAGRGKKIRSSAVKVYASGQELQILQPNNLKDPAFQQELESLNAELFVVVAFRMLPESVWAMPPKGTINLHASLLPQYRGAAPINHAIINGEQKSGVTTFFIEKEIDTGKVIERVEVDILPNMNAGELHDQLMTTGAKALLSTIDKIESGKYSAIDQKELLKEAGKLKPAPKIFREDCRIDFAQNAQSVHNKIRGLSPYPGAWIILKTAEKHTQFKILSSEISKNGENPPGEILTDNKSYIEVACSSGSIRLLKLQMEGKKKMPVEEFLRGFSFEKGMKFD